MLLSRGRLQHFALRGERRTPSCLVRAQRKRPNGEGPPTAFTMFRFREIPRFSGIFGSVGLRGSSPRSPKAEYAVLDFRVPSVGIGALHEAKIVKAVGTPSLPLPANWAVRELQETADADPESRF